MANTEFNTYYFYIKYQYDGGLHGTARLDIFMTIFLIIKFYQKTWKHNLESALNKQIRDFSVL